MDKHVNQWKSKFWHYFIMLNCHWLPIAEGWTAGLAVNPFRDNHALYIHFILKDEAVEQGITEEALIKEAQQIVRGPAKKRKLYRYGPVWACGGALLTGIAWLLTVLL